MAQAGDPIETVYVRVEADVYEMLKQTADGVERVEKQLTDMADKGSKGLNKAAKSAIKFSTILRYVENAAKAVVRTIINIGKAGVEAFKQITKQAIAANIQFESYATQFTTLLGSEQDALQRIEELTQFAVKTPFELPEIVEASRVLQVFGGTTLATGKNLTMVGDIAAGVGREFNEVALWVGRMYDAMQSGRPFGIAASRLQVMGAMTGKARAELEKMQAEGASGAELWEKFNELVGERWAGNMDRLSGTLAGIISNLQDFATNLMRIGGGPLFEELRESAGKLLEILEEKRPEIEAIAKAFGEVAANVADFLTTGLFEQLEGLDTQKLLEITQQLWDAAENARTLLEMLILLGSEGTIKPLDALKWAIDKINAALELAIPTMARFTAATTNDVDVLARLGDILAEHDKRVAEHAKAEEDAISSIDKRTQALQDQADTLEEVSDAERDIIDALATDMIDATEKMDRELEELDVEHGERLVAISEKTAERRLQIIKDYESRRQDMIDKAEEDLADLAEETARKRKDIEEGFRTDQKREQEDFNRDMRRLQFQYLDELADAVKNRDARAVVDLRRKFTREKQERTEDFQTRRQREQEDQAIRLRELADDERRRQQEIRSSLAKQLADQQKAHREQLIELQQSEAQQIASENAAYARRRAELQRALSDRLAQIAKELSDEEALNAEGAQRILEVLNKTFGVGGDIDQLMESFAARRRQKMIVRVAFEPEVYEPTRRSTTPKYGGEFQHGGAVIARQPTIAQFGEVPELATFTPLSKLGAMTSRREEETTLNLNLKLSGSAPPGIRSGDRDQIAAVLLQALRESGGLKRR